MECGLICTKCRVVSAKRHSPTFDQNLARYFSSKGPESTGTLGAQIGSVHRIHSPCELVPCVFQASIKWSREALPVDLKNLI